MYIKQSFISFNKNCSLYEPCCAFRHLKRQLVAKGQIFSPLKCLRIRAQAAFPTTQSFNTYLLCWWTTYTRTAVSVRMYSVKSSMSEKPPYNTVSNRWLCNRLWNKNTLHCCRYAATPWPYNRQLSVGEDFCGRQYQQNTLQCWQE
jgi:hypothetical protein